MRTRTLGHGLVVSAEGYGCMGLSEFYGPTEDAAGIQVLDRARELGITFWDTADIYGPFTNEPLVGRALAGHRDEIVLATKFGIERTPDGGFVRINGTPEYVRSSCEGSLRRLGVDVIDLYYQHRVDPTVPIEETWGAMSALVAEGKVRHLGISEAAPATIRRANAVHPVTALQTEWSLWTRDVEVDGVLATTRELGIGFVAYSPLGRGFLAGAFTDPQTLAADDWRRGNPRFQGENLTRNQQLAQRVGEIARDRGITPGQLALAWVMNQGDDVVPIPGTTKTSRLEENAAAVDITLTPEELAALDAVAPPGTAAGDRYPDMGDVYV